MKLIESYFEELGHSCLTIYGKTFTFSEDNSDEFAFEETREGIREIFLDKNSGKNILIANPAACAESMSLHHSCHYAIYYDLSYNGAQYFQSLDRIHRVGGSEEVIANYYHLIYEDTIDERIMENLERKKEKMNEVMGDYNIQRDEDEDLSFIFNS